MAAIAEVACQRQDLVVIAAALNHAVHFDGSEAYGRGRGDAVEHITDRVVDVVHAFEHGVVDAVEADCDAVQASVLERARLLRQQRTVGRQRQFHRQLRQLLNQVLDVAA